jgi:DNA-directed RNA polymerase specialized sigma24 family protein
MMAGSNCDCLICRAEKSLVLKLEDVTVPVELQPVEDASGFPVSFKGALDLVDALHASVPPTGTALADRLLVGLVRANASALACSTCQQLLLLAFIPTIHRTATHVRVAFPSLARDDVSQHVIVLFLESLSSGQFQRFGSHVAFAIARILRRRAFRWAIRESRLAPPENIPEGLGEDLSDREPLPAETVLERFLDNCQSAGWLSGEERHLLVEFKLRGVSCQELARRNGHSAVAIQHRIQRLVERLRRLAQKNPPRQLELFRR